MYVFLCYIIQLMSLHCDVTVMLQHIERQCGNTIISVLLPILLTKHAIHKVLIDMYTFIRNYVNHNI